MSSVHHNQTFLRSRDPVFILTQVISPRGTDFSQTRWPAWPWCRDYKGVLPAPTCLSPGIRQFLANVSKNRKADLACAGFWVHAQLYRAESSNNFSGTVTCYLIPLHSWVCAWAMPGALWEEICAVGKIKNCPDYTPYQSTPPSLQFHKRKLQT